MNNILNVDVSLYRKVFDKVGTTINLMTFLKSIKHRDEVLALRKIKDKTERNKLKQKLPAVTVSGVFSPTRSSSNLLMHSGLLCIDIDKQDNPHVSDMELLKQRLKTMPEVAYCALSASGKGIYAIIPLAHPERFNEQFLALQEVFGATRITVDRNCKDVCRLRSYSFDLDPYINTEAKPFKGLLKPEYRPIHVVGNFNSDKTILKVASLCQKVVNGHIDLTGGYQNWFTLGASLASLGEVGREYFHAISRQNDQYNVGETDKKFSQLLKSCKSIGIGTFIVKCRESGVYNNDYGL